MIKINSNNLKHYKDKGWCILKSGFSNVELLNFRKKVYEIEINAKKFIINQAEFITIIFMILI